MTKNAPPIPIILMTALRPNDNSRKSDVDRFRKASEMDFADVMLKPLDQDRLIHTLRQIEFDDSTSKKSDSAIEALQESIRSIQNAAEEPENSQNKDALLATIQTLQTQLAEMNSAESE